jgi:hypothetical protein
MPAQVDRKGLAPQAEKSMANIMQFSGHPQKGDQFITYVRTVKFAEALCGMMMAAIPARISK